MNSLNMLKIYRTLWTRHTVEHYNMASDTRSNNKNTPLSSIMSVTELLSLQCHSFWVKVFISSHQQALKLFNESMCTLIDTGFKKNLASNKKGQEGSAKLTSSQRTQQEHNHTHHLNTML